MKRRTLTLMICLLSVLSLVSVGFASWIITANDTEDVTGNIQIETVTDNRVFIVDIVDPSDIVFGAPKTPDTFANPWFTANEMDDENLSATITFKVVDANDTAVAADKVTVTANIELVGAKSFDDLVTDGYIQAAPTVTPVRSGDVYTITVTLNWGAKWGNKNPYNYYNALDVATYGDQAYNDITAFAALNTLQYKVTITATAK